MVSRMGLVGCFLLVAVALFNGAAADNYTVGDDLEWTIPPAGSVAYSTWANTKRFQINDTIVFKWSGSHTVAEVSKADYENCSNSNPLAFYDSSPASITLTSNVTRYFICTVGNHCSDLGQKVTIKISEDDDRWWDRNASSSLTVNIGALILSTAMAIFFYSFN
ncbi:stellacyanin-like [Pyrus ussuriensis x Pyrus communis]|uniref:Stellacyanin-like n=1 Tax=Pyrus ussuriensis x Pyrus communis TaxID=2448454 RepID=A0A5N5GTL1_9ROSA|nr:stellacyanin-like [Pyrus ussuriensis x Pyrus communis]